MGRRYGRLEEDTYICARASGDIAYLKWLRDRLVMVYNESPHVDYVQTIGHFIGYFERRRNAPKWLRWLLKRYSL